MSDARPLARFERDRKPALLRTLLFTPLFFAFVGYFFGGGVGPALGVGDLAGRVIAILGLVTVVVLLVYWQAGTGTVNLYPDAFTLTEGGRVTKSVDFDDVAFAVRTESFAEGLFGTATFELVAIGSGGVEIQYVTRPDELERRLGETLPTPADRFEGPPADGSANGRARRSTSLDTPRSFWAYWRADAPLPGESVVTRDRVEDVMDVDGVSFSKLDGVDVRDAEGLSDVDADDVTSSDSTVSGG